MIGYRNCVPISCVCTFVSLSRMFPTGTSCWWFLNRDNTKQQIHQSIMYTFNMILRAQWLLSGEYIAVVVAVYRVLSPNRGSSILPKPQLPFLQERKNKGTNNPLNRLSPLRHRSTTTTKTYHHEYWRE